jgi:hypothetical protein
MLKSIIALAAAASAMASPALAQNAASRTAAGIGDARMTAKAWPVGYQIKTVDAARSPWKPMSSADMARTQLAPKKAYATSVKLDYNRDGVMDMAYLANNGSQGAVIVALGGGKGQVVAFKADEQWAGGQELAVAGRSRIVLAFPESTAVVLSSESGKPSVYYIGDED